MAVGRWQMAMAWYDLQPGRHLMPGYPQGKMTNPQGDWAYKVIIKKCCFSQMVIPKVIKS
jgi:hypothetical protein